MGYNDRFGSSRSTTSTEKPPCFGDEYEEEHQDCLACPVRRGCKVLMAQRERRRARQEASRNRTTTNRPNRPNRSSNRSTTGRQLPARRHSASTDLEEVDHGEDISFFGALAINTTLSSISAGLGEARYAVDSIPRVAYPDPLSAAVRRGKKRAREEDE